jgi:peroxiredoxin
MNVILVVAVVLAWLLILVGGWLGWQLLRQNGRLLLRLEALEQHIDELSSPPEPKGLPVGTIAPEFELPNLAGERRRLTQLRAEPLLLVFFNPDCDYCKDLAPKLAALGPGSRRGNEADGSEGTEVRLLTSAATNSNPPLLIITTGDAEKNRQFFNEHRIASPVLLQRDGEVAKAYQANGTPTGYLIDADGRIASELAVGGEALLKLADGLGSSRREEAHPAGPQPPTLNPQPDNQSLVTSAATSRFGNRSLARSKIARDGLKAGTPAPQFRLPRLDGGELALEELRGGRVLLIFSDPHCGPCDALAPRLEQLHREHWELRVVMISRGEPKENRAKVKEHGLTFTVVLQQQWEISRRYAMFATPIAYLIDEAGVITHDVAAGENAILRLLAEASIPVGENDRPCKQKR